MGIAIGSDQGAAGEYNGRMTLFVVLSCMMAAMGGVIFGYDIGISDHKRKKKSNPVPETKHCFAPETAVVDPEQENNADKQKQARAAIRKPQQRFHCYHCWKPPRSTTDIAVDHRSLHSDHHQTPKLSASARPPKP
ncbi:hypothetical protein RHMOL_Rhmol03G0189100 [Rhododendron molle]|uniref:Uncharacterized protein n=1 Tax=Rhododendron molle TaxID=49168 RepID=A0ACC0PJ50_RHOML|nr:hypothetical protein RHMOL_Rhmol03G0189100 [Rhododendron molle]